MASGEIKIKVKSTETFKVLIGMKDDIAELFELVPDYVQEKEEIHKSLSAKWKRICELIELES